MFYGLFQFRLTFKIMNTFRPLITKNYIQPICYVFTVEIKFKISRC
jgi:hypothetical protein